MQRKAQGAFEYILLLAGVLLIVVIIVLLLRPLTSSQGNQQQIAICQSQLAASPTCYSSNGSWNQDGVPNPNTVSGCYAVAYRTPQDNICSGFVNGCHPLWGCNASWVHCYNGNTTVSNCNGANSYPWDADCVRCGQRLN